MNTINRTCFLYRCTNRYKNRTLTINLSRKGIFIYIPNGQRIKCYYHKYNKSVKPLNLLRTDSNDVTLFLAKMMETKTKKNRPKNDKLHEKAWLKAMFMTEWLYLCATFEPKRKRSTEIITQKLVYQASSAQTIP